MVSISNLNTDDRVRITYSANGGRIIFANEGSVSSGDVFLDAFNDGENDDTEDGIVSGSQSVGSGTWYTMLKDGHIDLVLLDGEVKITKIEIYSDDKAEMADRYNGSPATGYIAYFTSTGQLIAKEHVLNGGLEIHVGNNNDTQHAEVILSDQGPVSYVYDQDHYKMARQTSNSTTITDAAPTTGTFYKFMPDVDGTMTVRFKAYNVKYNNYAVGGDHGKDDGNETIVPAGAVTGVDNNGNKYTCPYYLMALTENNGTYTFGRYTHPDHTEQNPHIEWGHDHRTGDVGSFTDIKVEAGNTYYVYGWWVNDSEGRQPGASGFDFTKSTCGVAELIDVTFVPDNVVIPLAKWVPSNTTSDDDMATLSAGTTADKLHIKKMSDNIESCTVGVRDATVDGQAVKKLTISDITYKSGAKKGGTILIKIGDPNNDDDPVFAYTIAYDASEGHTWNFFENSLSGLKWIDKSGKAIVKDFKTANDQSGLLYDEMHEARPDGTVHTDWTFDYRVTKSATEKLDPMYLNKYPMVGNNADMMWDTEGLIINTDANKSCIYNDYTSGLANNAADHSSATDPDRYVGILPGGSFTIPQLDAGDRVVIFMGSGFGSGDNACKLNITGALDAIGQQISSSVIYNAGGSEWVYGGGTNTYRGAYQFISTGGDMTFTMNGGSMTKLYSIEIYSGVKSGTVDATRAAYDITFNGDEYKADDNAWYMRNDFRTTTPARSAYTLHYRGKGERLRLPTIVYKSGNINTDGDHLKYGTVGDNSAPFFFFKSEKEQYGMIRMRIDCMELNNNYVADYGMQNLTVGWLQKKTYPYTWDFTDLMGYVNNNNRIQGERTKVDGYALGQNGYLAKTTDGAYTTDNEFMNNTVGTGVKAVEQWKYYAASGNIPAGYGLHVRNEPYNGGVMWSGGELYAGSQAFSETLGLSFEPTGVDETYNGGLRVCNDGIYITGEEGKNWKIKVPVASSNGAVYVRAHEIGNDNVVAGVGNASTAFTYVGTATDNTGDKIYAVSGTGNDIDLIFNNHVIKKIAVSEDAKQFNAKGWTTESRLRDIDPSLTAYMTGHNIKTYLVTNVTYSDKTVELTEIGSNTTTDKLMHKSTANDDEYACILRNDADEQLNIVNSSFHLFVPDMHDEQGSATAKNYYTTKPSKMKSMVSAGTIEAQSGDYWNYGLGYQYYDIDPNTGKMVSGSPLHTGAVAFYRIEYEGASSAANKGYLPVLMSAGGGAARFSIVFADGDENQSVGIVANETESTGNGNYYNLNGQRLNGEPSRHGLYIVNGKKMYVK